MRAPPTPARARPGAPSWAGLAAFGLSLFSCYGVLALLPLLSAIGMLQTPAAIAWSSVIVLFAMLAVASVASGRRRHGRVWPAGLAAGATALLAAVMFVYFDRALEALAFAMLGAAVVADRHLRRRAGCADRACAPPSVERP